MKFWKEQMQHPFTVKMVKTSKEKECLLLLEVLEIYL
jgi:hypothetical protein